MSKHGLMTAACEPERKYAKPGGRGLVVDEVVNATEARAPNAGRARSFIRTLRRCRVAPTEAPRTARSLCRWRQARKGDSQPTHRPFCEPPFLLTRIS